jgi:hypothetical protein
MDTVPVRGSLQPRILRDSRAPINFLCKTYGKYLALEPRTETGYKGHYAEMRKSNNLTRKRNLKSKRTASKGVGTKDLSTSTKTYVQISLRLSL